MKIVISLILICLISACSEEKKEAPPSAKPVKSMVLKTQHEAEEVEFMGTISASIKANLSFEVAGKLEKLPVLEGQIIEKGQLLAAINTKRFDDLVFQAKAKYQLDEAQFNRAQKLIARHFISQSEYDILKSKMKIAKANLQTAEKDLKDTHLYAPFEGMVAHVYKENHEYVKAKEMILMLHDLSFMDVEIQVPESIAKQQSKSAKDKDDTYRAYATFSDFPTLKFPLTFKEYSSKADNETQTFRVIYSMKAPKKVNVLPGMSANVIIELPDFKNKKQAFFLIPSSAVFSSINKSPQVWLIDKKTNTIHAHTISTSNLSGHNIKVTSGLTLNDEIVTAGVHFLREGQTVKPLGQTLSIKGER